MPVRSMVAPLRRVAVRPPSPVADYGQAHWAMPVDPVRLAEQHEAFTHLLRHLGCDVEVLPAIDHLPDACFVYDPVFVTGRGAIELRGAKPVRIEEPPILAAELDDLGVSTIARLTGEATADGGDMCWLDEHTLAVGRSYRTNQEAVNQLRPVLTAEGVTVEVFDVPHDHGPEFCLHLMSVISPIRDDLVAVFERLAPVALLQTLQARGIEIISVPEMDYSSLGCNILTIEPGVVVIARGNDATKGILESRGVRVHEYAASEINKGEGGPTCLTRPLDRSA